MVYSLSELHNTLNSYKQLAIRVFVWQVKVFLKYKNMTSI